MDIEASPIEITHLNGLEQREMTEPSINLLLLQLYVLYPKVLVVLLVQNPQLLLNSLRECVFQWVRFASDAGKYTHLLTCVCLIVCLCICCVFVVCF